MVGKSWAPAPAAAAQCLLNACKGGGEVQILRQRPLHDFGHHRIVEAGPPFVELGCRQDGLPISDDGRIVEWSEA
jgi:hypothetical protein